MLASVNPEFDNRFWDLIHIGADDESSWVLVFLANDISKYNVEDYEKHIVDEE